VPVVPFVPIVCQSVLANCGGSTYSLVFSLKQWGCTASRGPELGSL